MIPLSTLPVTTVPRPEIENTSSTGIRNGLSSSLCGSGIVSSQALIRSTTFLAASVSALSELRA